MSQADAEDRHLPHQLGDRPDRIEQWFRIPRAVRKNMLLGLWDNTSSAVADPGSMVTRQPVSHRCRAMFHFMPK